MLGLTAKTQTTRTCCALEEKSLKCGSVLGGDLPHYDVAAVGPGLRGDLVRTVTINVILGSYGG